MARSRVKGAEHCRGTIEVNQSVPRGQIRDQRLLGQSALLVWVEFCQFTEQIASASPGLHQEEFMRRIAVSAAVLIAAVAVVGPWGAGDSRAAQAGQACCPGYYFEHPHLYVFSHGRWTATATVRRRELAKFAVDFHPTSRLLASANGFLSIKELVGPRAIIGNQVFGTRMQRTRLRIIDPSGTNEANNATEDASC